MVVTIVVQGLMMLGFIAINEGPRAVLAYGALVAVIYVLIAKFWGFRKTDWNSATDSSYLIFAFLIL